MLIGCLLLVMWRMPLSHQPSGTMPTPANFSASSSPIGPSSTLKAAALSWNRNGSPSVASSGTQARGSTLAVGGDVERAGAQAGQHRDVVAELLGAGDVHRHAAVRFSLDQLGEGLGRERCADCPAPRHGRG